MMNRILGLFFLVVYSISLNAQISMTNEKDGILITDNGKKVLFFQETPKGKDGKFIRCNYIHPLWAEDGTVLTEDFPADHLHHRGIFWTWHQVWIGDKRIGDPWEIKDFEQKVTEIEFIAQKGLGVLNTEVLWMSNKWRTGGSKTPYIKENTCITVHPLQGNVRRIDFEIKLLALTEGLRIGGSEDDKGYSGFSVRMKLPEDIRFEGPEGIVKPQRTAVESKGYINMLGSILKNGKSGGIVMLDHPDNPDYPQSWILRNRRSMQNAAYPGREAIQVSTEKPLVLKYSLLVYSGKLSEKKIKKNL